MNKDVTMNATIYITKAVTEQRLLQMKEEELLKVLEEK